MGDAGVMGAGLDIVDTGRMRELLRRWGGRFKDRVFTPAEQAYCESKSMPCAHYAGRWAVKESVAKAFGTGLGPSLAWLDIEVVRCPRSGAPSVRLSERAAAMAGRRGVRNIMVSLSHTRDYAVAQAILVGSGDARREDVGTP